MSSLLDVAAQIAGQHTAYRLGGGRGDLATCDCSSYVSAVFAQVGISLPAFTDAIADATPVVGQDLSQAQPGDLLLYHYSDAAQPGVRYPHVAIYAGGGQSFACQYPGGSGTYSADIGRPVEVHRVDGGGGGGGGGSLPVAIVSAISANPWLLILAGVGALLLLGGTRSNPRYRRNFDAFDGGGEIHPIRGSAGYDPEVEELQGAAKLRREQSDRYSDVRREKSTVDRPPWAVGISNAALEQLAREHGENASVEGWWERAHLYPSERGRTGARTSIMGRRVSAHDRGELDEVIGHLRKDKTRSADDVTREANTQARARKRKPGKYDAPRTRAGAYKDLPF